MKKTTLITIGAFATTSLFAQTLFVSKAGGNWTESGTLTEKNSSGSVYYPAPTTGVQLRMEGTSGTLNIDDNIGVTTISVWDKNHTITIAKDKTFTIGSGSTDYTNKTLGFNMQNSQTTISGEGTLNGGLTYTKFLTMYGVATNKSIGNVLQFYGGQGKAGTDNLHVSANTVLNGILWGDYNNSEQYKNNPTPTVNFSGSFTNTSTFYIKGNSAVNTLVKMTGKVRLNEVVLQNSANLEINSSDFKSTSWLGLLGGSTLKLVGKSTPYNIAGKIRLNGNATLILSGNNAYSSTNNANVINYEKVGNKVVIEGTQSIGGFAAVATSTSDIILQIDLAEATLLTLDHLIYQPASNDYLKTDSLTKRGDGTTKTNYYVEFLNFENGKVKLTNDLLTEEDWDHVIAEGWEDFKLGSDGFITATRVVPEPSTYAMIFGSVALAVALLRRRK